MITPKTQRPGYGENNPEPSELKQSATSKEDASDSLHADLEYINGQNPASTEKPHMPCKNSLPT